MIEAYVTMYNVVILNDMKTSHLLVIAGTMNTKLNEIIINERSSKALSSITSIQGAVYPLIFSILTKLKYKTTLFVIK